MFNWSDPNILLQNSVSIFILLSNTWKIHQNPKSSPRLSLVECSRIIEVEPVPILAQPSKIHDFLLVSWWLIPLSKWFITPVINGISRVNPLVTGVITHLLSGMNHQVVNGVYKPTNITGGHHPAGMIQIIRSIPPINLPYTSTLIILVGGLEHVLFFHILGISSSQLTNSYFSG